MNTVPNAHGTFMAQAIQTCQVGGTGHSLARGVLDALHMQPSG